MSKLITYSPTTPSRRNTVRFKADLDDVKPFKALTVGKKSTGGRDNKGRITSRHRGGGAKRKYRIINFQKKTALFDMPATVMSVEYDPNRTANIALIKYENGMHEYTIAPEGMKSGHVIVSGKEADVVVGNTMPLNVIPIGTSVFNIELKPGGGAVMVRSAGCVATLVGKEDGKAIVRLPSGETRIVNAKCLATIGAVSNALKKNEKLGKAGTSRHMGRRPHVRGVAMNPVDHPHGGGEGKTSGGRHPVSPWGQKAKGLKTRNNKRTDIFILSKKAKKRK